MYTKHNKKFNEPVSILVPGTAVHDKHAFYLFEVSARKKKTGEIT